MGHIISDPLDRIRGSIIGFVIKGKQGSREEIRQKHK